MLPFTMFPSLSPLPPPPPRAIQTQVPGRGQLALTPFDMSRQRLSRLTTPKLDSHEDIEVSKIMIYTSFLSKVGNNFCTYASLY